MRLLLIFLCLVWGAAVHAEAGEDLNSSLLIAYTANQSNRMVQSLTADSLKLEDSFGFGGDMRFRYMNFFEESLTHAFQLRVRGGFEGRINPRMSWGFKLASGGQGDNYRPVLNYDRDQFIGGFDGKSVWLSGAYLSYSPVENAVVQFGKLDKSPFLDPLRYNPLWDEDIAPEGLSAHYRTSVQNRYTFDLKTSWFFVNPVSPKITASGVERNKDGAGQKSSLGFLLKDEEWFDTQNKGMFSASGQALMSSNDYDLSVGVSYHNVQTKGALSKSKRNSTTVVENSNVEEKTSSASPQEYRQLLYHYSVVDLFLQMNVKSLQLYPVPLSLSLQLTQNFGAESNLTSAESFGFVVGGVLGRPQRTGHLNLAYHFFQLPNDVTLSHFVDSDIGGTGYTGHQLTARYFINEDMAFDFKYIMKMDSIHEDAKILHQGFASVLIKI